MANPIITLTTDFGLLDHYVGTMKGVLLGICPRAQLVDLSHEVRAYEIPEAAYLLAQAYRFFPPKTVHLVVVDPGVGTSRRPILAEAAGQFFVAPDNGVLTMIFSRETHKVRHVTAAKYFLKPVSNTFHGRDIFSPVAANIASGVPPARFGKLIQDYLRLNFEKPVRTGRRVWTGSILKVDRFGNMITNFHRDDFPDLETRSFAIAVGPRTVSTLARNYSEAGLGEVFAIIGSSGYLEISANQDSAARLLGCAPGAPAELTVF